MEKQWYTVREIADHFHISESMVRKLMQKRKLKHHRVGNKILIRIDEFEATVMTTIEDDANNPSEIK